MPASGAARTRAPDRARTRGRHDAPALRVVGGRDLDRDRTRIPRHREIGLSDDAAIDLYYAMVVARRISEQCLRLANQGAIDVSIPSDGHEAAQVASMRALRRTDFAYLFYRSVPAAYARGMSTREILLDSYGKAGGPSSGGKNLPGHWAKPGLRLMSISGSVGTQIPNAVGTALASRSRGEDAVTIVYFGDGGASKSDFHEGLNFAAIHHVPVILLCENNGLAISVPFDKQSPVPSVADRAAAYGVPGVSVDGSDPLAVYEATRDAVTRARRGEGPTLIEAKVTRLSQHTNQVGDDRTAAQIAAIRARDPLPRFASYLRAERLLDDDRDLEIRRRADCEVAEAVAFAEASADPAAAAAFQDVLAGSSVPKVHLRT